MMTQLFTRGITKTRKTEDWVRVETMKWKTVPTQISDFLYAITKTNRRSHYQPQHETQEEYLTRFHKSLLLECNNRTEDANNLIDFARGWINSHKNNAITYHKRPYASYYDKPTYKVSQDECTTYRHFYGSKGRGATYRSNFSVFRDNVMDSILFTKIDTSLEVKLTKEKYERDYEHIKQTLIMQYDRIEKDLSRRMSKETILQKAQKTMFDLARGSGTSTLGAFSFDMNAHTYYIDQETGGVINWNRQQYYTFSSVLPLKPEHKKILDEWNDKINDMTQQLYDASLDWYEVMSVNIGDALGANFTVDACDARTIGS